MAGIAAKSGSRLVNKIRQVVAPIDGTDEVDKTQVPGMRYQAIALLLSMAGWSWAWSANSTPLPADTILFNGMIFTSDPGCPNVQALAIQGERIEAVGDSEQIKRLAGPRTKQVD